MTLEDAGPVVAAVAPVTERFAAAGHRLYLVGGIVRDLLAGRKVQRQDIDLTTDARPEQVKELVAALATSVWTQGERFGTIGCIVGGHDLEITTHRAERYDGATRKPSVEFSGDVIADLSRRDFTVNAMAIEVTSPMPQLIDPFDGAGDLAVATLRTPIDPEVSFTDDPLRMLRAARFVAGFSLAPVAELETAVRTLGDRMSIVSRERVRDELEKLLATADPTSGLQFLDRTGLLPLVLAEVASRAASPDRGGCHADALAHTVALVATTEPGSTARRTALLAGPALFDAALFGAGLFAVDPFDAGSVDGTTDDLGGRTSSTMRSLRYSRDTIDAVRAVIDAVPEIDGPTSDSPGGDDASLRRFALAAGGARADVIDVLTAEATLRSDVDGGTTGRRVAGLVEGLARLAALEDLDHIAPVATGDDVRRHLDLPAGPSIGAALAHLMEQRLDLGSRSLDDELADLDRWWAAR